MLFLLLFAFTGFVFKTSFASSGLIFVGSASLIAVLWLTYP
jgi:hypothetical protein